MYFYPMRFHKEGWSSLVLVLAYWICSALLAHRVFSNSALVIGLAHTSGAFFTLIIVQFFRHPKRIHNLQANAIIAPADGTIVVIENTQESEYFKDMRLQISIFMSPINVHVNRYPISGTVQYVKYHAGKYLIASHPKSSTENERTTIVVSDTAGRSVLFRQIAGALARRIVYYCKTGDAAQQAQQMGFIKFGSRVDVFLPITAKVKVVHGQKVKGSQTVLAEW
jgi:phosphatidylserine decarboxylase